MSVSYLVRGGGCGEERRWCGSAGRGVGRSYEKEDNYSGGAADLVMWTHKVVMAAAPRLLSRQQSAPEAATTAAPPQLNCRLTQTPGHATNKSVCCQTLNRGGPVVVLGLVRSGGGAGPGLLRWW